MSLALRSSDAAIIMRSSAIGVFDVTVGTIYGRLSPNGGTEQTDGANVALPLHKFRYRPGQTAFTERDHLAIGSKEMEVILIKDAGGAGKESVAELREYR
jgi:hypothetical protein